MHAELGCERSFRRQDFVRTQFARHDASLDHVGDLPEERHSRLFRKLEIFGAAFLRSICLEFHAGLANERKY